MNDISSPSGYRFFQRTILGVGALVTLMGVMTGQTVVVYAGFILFAHGLVAKFILWIENRREGR